MTKVDLPDLYYLSPGCPPREAEDLGESVLGGGGLGQDTARFWPTPGRGVDHHGLLDAGEQVEQRAHRVLLTGLRSVTAHQVRDLQCQHAGERVDTDGVVSPVVHRAERD